MSMYSQAQSQSSMAPPQKPETFMLSNEAQQSLPQDAQVALQQVDNRKSEHQLALSHLLIFISSKILPHLCSRRLDARSIYSSLSSSNGRVCLLCVMVSVNALQHDRG